MNDIVLTNSVLECDNSWKNMSEVSECVHHKVNDEYVYKNSESLCMRKWYVNVWGCMCEEQVARTNKKHKTKTKNKKQQTINCEVIKLCDQIIVNRESELMVMNGCWISAMFPIVYGPKDMVSF